MASVLTLTVCQTDAPNVDLIDQKEILGPTVILLTCSYMDQEFIRIGYYVNNEYETPEMNENPPEEVAIARVVRNILADSPRVTRFDIKWAVDPSLETEMTTEMQGMRATGNTGNEGECSTVWFSFLVLVAASVSN